MLFRMDDERYKKYFENRAPLAKEFLQELIKFLEAHKDDWAAREIYDALKNNDTISAFSCREDCLKTFAEEMTAAGLPFIICVSPKGKIGIITRTSDTEAVKDVQKKVIQIESHLCKRLTEDKMRQELRFAGADAEIVHLENLTEVQARSIMQRIEKDMMLNMAALDKAKDGTYRIAVKKSDLTKVGRFGIGFGALLVANAINITGYNRSDIVADLRRTLDLDIALAHLRTLSSQQLEINPLYLVDPNGQYVKFSGQEVTYGHTMLVNGETIFSPEKMTDKMNVDYENKVNSYVNRLSEPTVFHDTSEINRYVRDHVDAKGVVEVNRAEDKFAAKVNAVVTEKMGYDEIVAASGPVEQLNYQLRESAGVIESAVRGESYPGVPNADMKELSSMIEQNQISINAKELPDQIKNIEIKEDRMDREHVRGRSIAEIEKEIDSQDIGREDPSRNDREVERY